MAQTEKKEENCSTFVAKTVDFNKKKLKEGLDLA